MSAEENGDTGLDLAEFEQRVANASRMGSEDLPALLAQVQDAVAADLSTAAQFGSDLETSQIAHAKWQLIHRFIQRTPYRDEAPTRPEQWRLAMDRARQVGDLELIEWVQAQIDKSRVRQTASTTAAASTEEQTYLALLAHVAARKRQARAELRWAQEAEANGWGTCTTQTLGRNLIDLHAASVHSRDNPEYAGPVDGAYRKD